MSNRDPLFFFYDYVDPASYILELRLLGEGYIPGSTLQLRPFEINPPPLPLLDPDQGEWRDHWDRTAKEAKEMGVSLARPWIVPWSRKAHELAQHAAEHDLFQETHEALFRAYLIEGRDIGRVDVLVEVAGENGLDATGTKAVLDVDRHRDALEATRLEGTREGVVRPPVLRLQGKTLHGNPTSEELRSFLAPGVAGKEP